MSNLDTDRQHSSVQFKFKNKFLLFFFVHYPTEIFEYPHEMEYRVVVA